MTTQDSPHILIVDDEITVNRQVGSLLQEFGLEYGFVTHPSFLFQRLEAESFDLILLDLHMPEVDGLTLLRQLKSMSNPLLHDLPVIVLTADEHSHLLEECFQAGATDFITKPIDPLVLKARVNSALEVQRQIRTVNRQKFQMQRELRLAAQVQQTALPTVPDVPFLNIQLSYEPLSEVSGDIYDVVLHEDGSVNVFLGDATGHGTAAALVTMLVTMGLASIRHEASPRQILKHINSILAERLPLDIFMTAVCLHITPTGKMIMSSAGHPPILIMTKEGALKTFHEKGLALGIYAQERIPFGQQTYDLKPGDRLILHTDGLFEWADEEEEVFGEERLYSFFHTHHHLSAAELFPHLMQKIQTFVHNHPREDDLTLLVLEYEGCFSKMNK